jgi:putative addiction module CopG family antidote
MAISLTPEMEQRVERQIDGGRFKDANEVLGESLRLLEEREHKLKISDPEHQEMKRRFLERMENARDLGTNGVITWTRDEIHER